MKTLRSFSVYSLLCLSSILLSGQLIAQTPSLFDRLAGAEVREITLHTDLAQLLDNRTGEPVYQPAEMTIDMGNGLEDTWSLKLKARGKYRRRICDFPPIKLNFPKSDLRARGLSEFDGLKLVTHCTEGRADGIDNVLREYLAYRMYNILTPNSFRVQLVRIQYVDTKGKVSAVRRYGFLIEDTDELAARLGGEECACLNPGVNEVSLADENLHALFQYFIGNTDYSLPTNRNLKLVRRHSDGQLLPVGYDFDFSGMVNAPYAIPSLQLGQMTVQHRIFLGLPTSNEVMEQNIALFRARRAQMHELITGFRLLSRASREEMVLYADGFYQQLDQLDTLTQPTSWYQRLRQQAPYALPAGGSPEVYGVSK